jgi:uncharacterized membrane protein
MPKPKLSQHLERNIRIIENLREESDKARSFENRAADTITFFSGSMKFLYLHGAWFIVWIVINMNWIPGVHPFDPYPFGLLTMVVSLEAIFLSTLVLISQNREAELNSRKESLDLQIDMLAEYEVTHTLRLLRQIAEKLEIAVDPELNELCQDVAPDIVMHEIQSTTSVT